MNTASTFRFFLCFIKSMMHSFWCFCSFDEESASYILEKGDYNVLLGNSVESARVVAVINLDDDVTVMKTKNLLRQIEDFEELKQNRADDDSDSITDSFISEENTIQMSHTWFETVVPDYEREKFIPQETEESKDNGAHNGICRKSTYRQLPSRLVGI